MHSDNKKINILILDDEKLALDYITKNLKKAFQELGREYVQEIYSTHDQSMFWFLLKQYKPEIVVLDIHMPYKSGIEIAEMIIRDYSELGLQEVPGIVFCTAFESYGAKAERLNVMDYVLKPASISKLKESILNIEKQYSITKIKLQLTDEQNKRHLINLTDIVYFMSDNRNVFAVDRDGLKYQAQHTLADIGQDYRFLFISSHRSFLVNKKEVLAVSEDNESLLMSNKQTVPISRRKREEMLQIFLK